MIIAHDTEVIAHIRGVAAQMELLDLIFLRMSTGRNSSSQHRQFKYNTAKTISLLLSDNW